MRCNGVAGKVRRPLEFDDRPRCGALAEQRKADQAVIRAIVPIGNPHGTLFELEQSPPVLRDFFAHRLRNSLLWFHVGLHHRL